MEKINIAFLIIVIIALVLAYTQIIPPTSKEQTCIDSGGTVETGLCCLSVGDFPNTCVVGACGCSPENSHEVTICDCGEGKCFDGSTCVAEINSFDGCVAATGQVMESYPRQCRYEDMVFVEEHCTKKETYYTLALADAKQAAINSECGDRLKETYVCNQDTGTYWIDLDIEREGCNPACVVNIETREAEINWRCTGLID